MAFQVRLLGKGDETALDDFLRPHTAEAFFLRSNFYREGVTYEAKPLQAQYLGAFDGDKLVGVVGYSWIHTILVFAEDPACIGDLAQALRPLIQVRNGEIEAVLGLADHVTPLLKHLGLTPNTLRKDAPQILYRLNVGQMKTPALLGDPAIVMRSANEKDLEQIVAWRMAFNIEVAGSTPGPKLEESVRKDVGRKVADNAYFILEQGGVPISMCGAEGYVPEAILIGPVYTPPELRNRGYAKAVTAGAIGIVAAERPTLREAILFTPNPAAAKAYEAIGFQNIGNWGLALVKEDYRLPPLSNAPRQVQVKPHKPL